MITKQEWLDLADIIKLMIEKEKEHLKFLSINQKKIDEHWLDQIIRQSADRLEHFILREKQYRRQAGVAATKK